MPAAPTPAAGAPTGARRPMLGRWLDLLLAVSVEFCMVFWAASAFIAWDHATLSQGPALASLFLVGMATARAFSARIIGRVPHHRALVLPFAAPPLSRFPLFWSAPPLPLAAPLVLVT